MSPVDHLQAVLDSLGYRADPEGRDTPGRLLEVLVAFAPGRPPPRIECFDAPGHDLVVIRAIPFHSLCAHHLLPFFGDADIAYRRAEEVVRGKITLLSKTPAGHVIVCSPNNHEVGLMGDLSAQALKHKGVLAYVVDGGCRDCDFILEQKFAVFHIFFTPIDIVARWILDHCEQAVTQGKVAISTGRYLLCDWDGVVVTPNELVQTVVTQTEAVAMAENQVRAPILDGMDPVEAYLKYGKF